MLLKIRLLDGTIFPRTFAPARTLREVLAAIHFSGHRLDPQRTYKLAQPPMLGGASVEDLASSLEALGVQRGMWTLSEQ